MGRSLSSRSRSRSAKNKRKRNPRDHSSSSDQDKKKMYKKEKQSFGYRRDDRIPPKSGDKKVKSDLKNHFVFENVKIGKRSNTDEIIQNVKRTLKDEFGSVEHATKLSEGDEYLSFNVGFKYDSDALKLHEDGAVFSTSKEKIKITPKPTIAFEKLIPYLKERKMEEEDMENAKRKVNKVTKRSRSQQSNKKKRHRYDRSSSRNSRDRKHDRRDSNSNDNYQRKEGETQLWIFGLPSTIKGKEVQHYLQHLQSGPFYVTRWKWIRVKNSNCQFMQVILQSKKAAKLLQIKQQMVIEGLPFVILEGGDDESDESLRKLLRQFQIRIKLPQQISGSVLHKAVDQICRVVQLTSLSHINNGASNSFSVTVNNANKARELRRLGKLSTGIIVEELQGGQLVYRPTKNSKLVEAI